VRTLSPALLLKVPASTIDDLYRHDIKAYALFVLNIAREISRRLRVADGILADLVVSVVHRRGSPAG
jgi:CRP-like cAMP-binding protein